jgi:poly(3-hydroxyalkanoate) depolymerase
MKLPCPGTATRIIDVDGQALRVLVKPGTGTPLLIFNGIGASLELLAPFIEALGDVEVVTLDVPGVGGSELPAGAYRFPELARLADRMLETLGYDGPVDVLGVSWGGAVAQQFAHTCASRCRRLILAATTPGILMIPGRPSLFRLMLDGRRYRDPDYLSRIAPELYGGAFRRDPNLIRRYAVHFKPPDKRGYFYQQLAFLGWTSLHWLLLLRQPTLVLSGESDPLIPSINGRILSMLIPKARLRLIDDGHLFLITSAAEVALIVREFLRAPDRVA